jgi:hypothetical protein
MLQQHNDQLETEKYVLNQQLENQSSINLKQERNTPTPGKLFVTIESVIHQYRYIDSTSSESKRAQKQTHIAPIHEVYKTTLYSGVLYFC